MVIEQLDSTLSATAVELWNACYEKHFEAELNFYLEQVVPKSPLQPSILNINCGTGQLLFPLLEKGHTVVGLETDKTLLHVLHKKAASQSHSLDVRTVTFDEIPPQEAYSTIVALDTIQSFLDENALRSFFKQALSHLAPEGTLLFSFVNPFTLWNSKQWVTTEAYTFDNGFGRIETTITPQDHLNGTATVQKYCMVKEKGAPFFDFTTETKRFYTLTELVLLLEDVGFTNIKTHADCNAEPIHDETKQGTMLYTIAQKP
ncbi:class I SAM-dependent methyltransferase [Halodesulfovibrio sp.]|jgi:2-polyprenyl-3-methyl-5-hydroxy-6-metoxy-1,4-benzoquinol methylase|uniref:class I SAM-dependent methyltransferase n=1 Tax=Halodesulfovibrio sp. TaxID=1912772 RepID=UPI0025DD8AB2|nr:class I SAM-dependent methyltransferase [Halodesulfovibrio sp.]MCT4626397.1 class I SAM-dependent methyltransferase [Halodesulfovibrio sp.]